MTIYGQSMTLLDLSGGADLLTCACRLPAHAHFTDLQASPSPIRVPPVRLHLTAGASTVVELIRSCA